MKCLDCKKLISKEAKRCQKCYGIWRSKHITGNKIGSYIDGRVSKKYYCKCGKEVPYSSVRKGCKRCSECFRKFNKGKNHHSWKGGLTNNKKYKREKQYERLLKNRYNLTIKEYNRLTKKQQGKCKICKTSCKRLFVDHNHKTGVVRGLICLKCNSAIGFLRDDIDIAQKIIKYLKGNAI
jgi:hypothetical protein